MGRFVMINVLVLLCATMARSAEGDVKTAGGGVVPVPSEGFAWQKAGYKELKGAPPKLDPPIGERVTWSMSGKDKEGKPAGFAGAIQFGKSTYHFQAFAGSEEEAKTLAKVAEKIKE